MSRTKRKNLSLLDKIQQKSIILNDDYEEEDCYAAKLIWIFGGGMKIGSTVICNSLYKPHALFTHCKMTIKFKCENLSSFQELNILYKNIKSIELNVRKKEYKGRIIIITENNLNLPFLVKSNNNKIELFFNEYTKMVESGFLKNLQFIPVLSTMLLNSPNLYKPHNYNTRFQMRKRLKKTSKKRKEIENLTTFITFPKYGIKSISLTNGDISLLNTYSMLNDSIIDFYCRYIEMSLKKRKKDQNFHFFSSFFYKMLENSPKNALSWTKKVDIFSKQFLVFPVNEGMHWKLYITCFANNVVTDKWDSPEHYPRIVSLNSLKSNRYLRKNAKNIRAYLSKEYESRTKEKIEFTEKNMKVIEMKVAKQKNMVDCGVYMLEFLERFCENGFENTFSSETLGSFQFDQNFVDQKRNEILKIIFKLKKES